MSLTMSVHEAKAKLSELIVAAERGETVSITRRGVRVADVVAAPRLTPRPMEALYPTHYTEAEIEEIMAPAFTDDELREFGLI